MAKYFTLLTVLLVVGFGVQAQIKFGVAAGYEHITNSHSTDMGSGGGLAGGLLFRYDISNHIELDLAFTMGDWKTGADPYVGRAIYGGGTGGGSVPYPISHVRVTIVHVLAPFHVCYVIPRKKYSLFLGPGYYFSRTSMDGGENFRVVNSRGLSVLAGIRWGHWQVAADYRPRVADTGSYIYGNYFSGEMKHDVSIKLGLNIGKTQKKKQS
jgi:hypothetical protein